MVSFINSLTGLFKTKTPDPVVQKESQTTSQDWIRNLMSGNVRGFKSKFITDIYKERILYPHEEMAIASKAFSYNAYIASASRTRGNFILHKLVVTSDDKKTEDNLNRWIDETGLGLAAAQFLGKDCIVTGNFYAERIRSGTEIVKYDYVPNSERMYIITDDKGIVQSYFQELPERFSGTKFKTINYYGDKKRAIRGIEIDKNKIFHVKMGCSELPQYGRGYVSTVANDIEILLEVERAIAVISRYKAIPKKLIQLKRGDDPNGGKAAEIYANQISSLSDVDNPVIPEEIKVDDLSYSGKELNFQPIIDYLKRKITVNLAPSFIIHGEETNYAVSREQKEALITTVQTEREIIKYQLIKELKILSASKGFKPKEFSLEFGEFDLGQDEEKKNYAKDLFSSNIITLNEAREILGFPVHDELGDSFASEIQSTGGLIGLGGEEPEQEGETVYPDQQNTEET